MGHPNPMWEMTGTGWQSTDQDYVITYIGPQCWRLKWRTSAMTADFDTAKAAKDSV